MSDPVLSAIRNSSSTARVLKNTSKIADPRPNDSNKGGMNVNQAARLPPRGVVYGMSDSTAQHGSPSVSNSSESTFNYRWPREREIYGISNEEILRTTGNAFVQRPVTSRVEDRFRNSSNAARCMPLMQVQHRKRLLSLQKHVLSLQNMRLQLAELQQQMVENRRQINHDAAAEDTRRHELLVQYRDTLVNDVDSQMSIVDERVNSLEYDQNAVISLLEHPENVSYMSDSEWMDLERKLTSRVNDRLPQFTSQSFKAKFDGNGAVNDDVNLKRDNSQLIKRLTSVNETLSKQNNDQQQVLASVQQDLAMAQDHIRQKATEIEQLLIRFKDMELQVNKRVTDMQQAHAEAMKQCVDHYEEIMRQQQRTLVADAEASKALIQNTLEVERKQHLTVVNHLKETYVKRSEELCRNMDDLEEKHQQSLDDINAATYKRVSELVTNCLNRLMSQMDQAIGPLRNVGNVMTIHDELRVFFETSSVRQTPNSGTPVQPRLETCVERLNVTLTKLTVVVKSLVTVLLGTMNERDESLHHIEHLQGALDDAGRHSNELESQISNLSADLNRVRVDAENKIAELTADRDATVAKVQADHDELVKEMGVWKVKALSNANESNRAVSKESEQRESMRRELDHCRAMLRQLSAKAKNDEQPTTPPPECKETESSLSVISADDSDTSHGSGQSRYVHNLPPKSMVVKSAEQFDRLLSSDDVGKWATLFADDSVDVETTVQDVPVKVPLHIPLRRMR